MIFASWHSKTIIMFRSYILIAFRNLVRQKLYSIINILGLAVGISLFCLIMLYVADQYSYDRFNENYDEIYRLENGDWAIVSPSAGDHVYRNIPGILAFSRVDVMHGRKNQVRLDEKSFRLENLIFTDTMFFDIFTFDFIHGDPRTAMGSLHNIILSESTARFLFGTDDAVGQTIRYDDRITLVVSGVVRDPNNFHLPFNAVASILLLPEYYREKDYLQSMGDWNFNTYFLLPKTHDASAIEKQITGFFRNLYKDHSRISSADLDFSLRPLGEIYFAHTIKHEAGVKHANRQHVNMFALVAVFILLLACINFINLATARASSRAREVGLRKVLGGQRKQLMAQFLSESVLTVIISFVLSLLITELLLPWFNTLAQTSISLHTIINPFSILVVIAGIFLLGIASGFYPAFYLTSFQPASVIKGEITRGTRGAMARKILTLFQFTISIALIAGTLIVYEQLNYMKNKNLGFDKEHIVWFSFNRRTYNKKDVLRERLLSYPGILMISAVNQPPGLVTWQESERIDGTSRQYTFMHVDPEYIDMMGIELLAGRNFNRDYATDEQQTYILNEEALRFFGWHEPHEEIIGREFRNGRIIGIVRDHHFNSLQQPISPLVFSWHESWTWAMMVRISGSDIPKTIGNIQKEFSSVAGEQAFEYSFLDESFDRLYQKEEQFGKVFSSFSLLAVFIACLGLFGMASYATMQRRREIGIRKVFGAAEHKVMELLIRNFVNWVLLANLIAWPLAWYATEQWLLSFHYRIDQSIWVYLLAAVIALIIALATVSVQAFKAARANPVDSLKYE
jgi:putative ABC transport system permease protein